MDIVEILVTGRNLSRPALDEATSNARGLGGVMGKMATVSTEALVGIAVASVHMAAEFQTSTTRLITSAGESTKNIDMVRKGMLDMAGQVGVKAEELSKAMYYVEAAGFHAADGLTVLKAAAQGAAAEGADTTTVAKALTDILVDYHLKASDAADVTSKMVAAISHGKTNLQDFSGAFASIIPAASAAGISMGDAMAALANMTNHGFTAARAAQNLAQALRSLLNPTKPMQKAFTEFGVSAATLREKLNGPNGLTDAMEYLSKSAEKAGKEGTPAFAAALKLLMGTAPGANAALATVGENFKATSDTIKAIGSATADSQGKVQGFAEVQKTLGMQVKELNAQFNSLMIELGNKLIPILTSVTSLLLSHKGAVLQVLGAMAALMALMMAYSTTMKVVAVAQGFMSVATQVLAGEMTILNAIMDANVFVVIAIAVIALVAGVIYAYTHFKVFREVVSSVMSAIKTVVTVVVDAVVTAWKWLVSAAETVAHAVVAAWNWLGGAFDAVGHALVASWNWVVGAAKATGDFLAGVWNGIAGAAETVGHALVATWNGIVGAAKAVGDFLTGVWNAIAGAVSSVWNGIIDFFKKWWPLLLVIFAPEIAALISLWNHFHQQIISIATSVWNAVKGFFMAIWNAIKTGAEAVWRGIQVAIIGPMETVWHWLVIAWNTITGLLGNAWRAIAHVAAVVWGAVSSAIVASAEAVWHVLVAVWNTVTGWLGNAWRAIAHVASSVWNSVASAVVGPMEGAWHALTSIGGRIISAIGGAFDSAWKAVSNIGSKFWSIGGDIISGIINGVEGAASSLFHTMENIANDALKSAKSFLGIGSPSKRAAAEIGQWIPPGMGEGALANAAPAHAAMQKLSASMLATGAAAIRKGSAGMMAGLPVGGSGMAGGGAYAGGGPGGGSQPILVQLLLDSKVVAEQLMDPLRYQVRLRGGSAQTAFGKS